MNETMAGQIPAQRGASHVATSDGFGVWVPVAQKLPPIDQEVLVAEKTYDNSGYYIKSIATYGPPGWDKKAPPQWEVVANCGGYECERDDIEPTHWMRLPPAPSSSNKKDDTDARSQ